MRALGGDSKTQDGINCHVGIIEYHAHKDDTVKENLESSTVQRKLYLSYHYGWCQCAIGLQAI
jgi:phage terminase large subunit-like protein